MEKHGRKNTTTFTYGSEMTDWRNRSRCCGETLLVGYQIRGYRSPYSLSMANGTRCRMNSADVSKLKTLIDLLPNKAFARP